MLRIIFSYLQECKTAGVTLHQPGPDLLVNNVDVLGALYDLLLLLMRSPHSQKYNEYLRFLEDILEGGSSDLTVLFLNRD